MKKQRQKMAKVSKIKKVKNTTVIKNKNVKKSNKFSPIDKHISNKTTSLIKRVKKEEKQQVEALRKTTKNLSQLLEDLKHIVKAYKDGLTINTIRGYSDIQRIQRAKHQLRVYFVSNFSKNRFRFLVKSSGLNEPDSYFVDIEFSESEVLSHTDVSHKDILLNSKIKTQCTCDDFKYRFRYWLTQMGSVLGVKEHRYPKITNPKPYEHHKFVCKHQILVFNGITKPSFQDGIFKRYINNLRVGKKGVKVTQKDTKKTYLASHKTKINKDF